jgi:hypothetical protein
MGSVSGDKVTTGPTAGAASVKTTMRKSKSIEKRFAEAISRFGWCLAEVVDERVVGSTHRLILKRKFLACSCESIRSVRPIDFSIQADTKHEKVLCLATHLV